MSSVFGFCKVRVSFKLLSFFLIVSKCRSIFTARCYASAVLAMCMCVSVRLSQVGVLLKRLNVGSHIQHHTIIKFSDAKDLREIRPESPPTGGGANAGEVGQNRSKMRDIINTYKYPLS